VASDAAHPPGHGDPELAHRWASHKPDIRRIVVAEWSIRATEHGLNDSAPGQLHGALIVAGQATTPDVPHDHIQHDGGWADGRVP
jgi:hypothetical protein